MRAAGRPPRHYMCSEKPQGSETGPALQQEETRRVEHVGTQPSIAPIIARGQKRMTRKRRNRDGLLEDSRLAPTPPMLL